MIDNEIAPWQTESIEFLIPFSRLVKFRLKSGIALDQAFFTYRDTGLCRPSGFLECGNSFVIVWYLALSIFDKIL
jgi:hypothetical protein